MIANYTLGLSAGKSLDWASKSQLYRETIVSTAISTQLFFRLTVAELVIWRVMTGGVSVDAELPPQALMQAAATSNSTVFRTIKQKRLEDVFLRSQANGSSRIGRSGSAAATPGSVSVKTTVTVNAPACVLDRVLIDTKFCSQPKSRTLHRSAG